MSLTFRGHRRRYDGHPLFAKRPGERPGRIVMTESNTLQPAATTFLDPEGNKTESNTLQPAATTILNPEGNKTESNTLQPAATTILDPEEHETESTPVQGKEPGVRTPEHKLGYQPCRFGRDVDAGGELHRQKALADHAEAQSMAIGPGPKAEVPLHGSRSLVLYELSAVIRSALAAKGITSLTPLQEQAVETLVGRSQAWYIQRPGGHDNPTIFELVGSEKPENLKEGEKALQGNLTVKARQNLICLAKIGADRTLAYLIPLYEHLLVDQQIENELKRPRIADTFGGRIIRDSTLTPVALPFALIVVPTRKLAIQVYSDMADLALTSWIQPAGLYGGTSRKDQADMLSRGCDILVATPGRLIDMLQGSFIDGVKTLSLEFLSHIVWDEADELLSIGFANEMRKILDIALLYTPPVHHWFFSSQYEEKHIAKAKTLIRSGYIHMTFGIPNERVASRYSAVKQIFIKVGANQSERFDALEKIIINNPDTKFLILCETRATVEEIHAHLTALDLSFCSTHGGHSQGKREEAMFRFKKNTIAILVSTMGIAGRGFNMKGVETMVFWEMPVSLDQYKWCLGRVGRLGNPAKAYVLYTRDNHPRDYDRCAKFLDVTDAEFDLDVDGNKVANDPEEE